MKKLAVVVAFAGLLAGCNQQAVTDLAACKVDLTKLQAEASAAKVAADAKIASLEQTSAALQAKVTEFENAAAAAAAEAQAKVDAGKAKVAAKVTAVKKAAAAADAVVANPTKATTTTQQKARSVR